MDGETHIWKFTPVARPDDPVWQDRQIWVELQIVAVTSGEAILLASRFDAKDRGKTTRDSQDHQQVRSGFEDERLYRVDRLEERPLPPAVSGTIVRAMRLV